MIGPHLGGERHAEILQRSRFRSKRELLRLIAEIDPKPEVPALVQPLGPAPAGPATHAAFMTALARPVRELPPGRRPEDWMEEVQLRALRTLVKELRRKKRAATDRPRKQVASSDATDAPAREPPDATDAPARARERATRHISAPVRRAVFERDASRCAYRDERGERCRETCSLELHHRHAHALGGASTLENLELRCRPHNTLAAEQDFGREHMDWMRGVTEAAAPEPPL